MATFKGSEGAVHVGSNAVAEVRSWSIEESADTIETTTMGATARTRVSSLTTWSGSIEAYWDDTDTNGQGALTIGAEVTLNLYPEGNITGNFQYTGSAIVTGITSGGSFDGLVEASFTFEGNGALTKTTAT